MLIQKIVKEYQDQAEELQAQLVNSLFLDRLAPLEKDARDRYLAEGDNLTIAIDEEEDAQGEKIELQCKEGVTSRTRALGLATVTKCNSCLQKLGFLVHRLHNTAKTMEDKRQETLVEQTCREVVMDLGKYAGAVLELMNDVKTSVGQEITGKREFAELDVVVGLVSTFLDVLHRERPRPVLEPGGGDDVMSLAVLCALMHFGVNLIVNFVTNAVVVGS